MAKSSGTSLGRASLWADQVGSITAEYAILLSTVAVGCALAIGRLGVPLFRMYLAHRAWLLLPMP